MRYPLEIAKAMRTNWPKEKPMSVRISANDWLGEDGITPKDSVEIAKMFKNLGIDIIDVSSGQTSKDASPVYGRMFQTPFSDRIRNEVGIKTMAVGNIYEVLIGMTLQLYINIKNLSLQVMVFVELVEKNY